MSMEVNGILVAAHELKAPLALMRQLTLALKIAPDLATRNRLESQLVEVSERSLRRINDLTKIARLEDGLFELEPVSVRGVCDAVLQEIRPLFDFEHHALSFHYANKSRLAIANRDLLHSIVYNFCTNALRYSDAGLTSTLSVGDYKGQIRISVRDYGPALPTAIWREIQFGSLRGPTSISMRSGSSGLGLYIASEFARHMHTKIGAIRHHDGTSFYITLPVSEQASFVL